MYAKNDAELNMGKYLTIIVQQCMIPTIYAPQTKLENLE
jgi:hypothetical protein